MNESLQLAEIICNALKANGVPVGCASLGIVTEVLEASKLPVVITRNNHAKLSAAAPDLLEACQIALEWFSGGDVNRREFLAKLQAAVKKATE